MNLSPLQKSVTWNRDFPLLVLIINAELYVKVSCSPAIIFIDIGVLKHVHRFNVGDFWDLANFEKNLKKAKVKALLQYCYVHDCQHVSINNLVYVMCLYISLFTQGKYLSSNL